MYLISASIPTPNLAQVPNDATAQQLKKNALDNMKKCGEFLQDLIKLSSQVSNENPHQTRQNVILLIQLLIVSMIMIVMLMMM